MAHILVVEDEETIRNLICWNLELVGHQCSAAADGREAKKVLEDETFDLVLLDVMLPGLDGFQLAEYCRHMPVMFVTAKEGIEDKMKGFRAGRTIIWSNRLRSWNYWPGSTSSCAGTEKMRRASRSGA